MRASLSARLLSLLVSARFAFDFLRLYNHFTYPPFHYARYKHGLSANLSTSP